MLLRPEDARAALPHVDPGRIYNGRAVGLRDQALLVLVAAGLTSGEIVALRATSITMAAGRVVVSIRRRGAPWSRVLTTDLGAPLLAWLTEVRRWGEPGLVFEGEQGPLSASAVRKVLDKHKRALRRRAGTPAALKQ